MRLTLDPPEGFRFGCTVHSHGWCSLAPFRFEAQALATTISLSKRGALPVSVRSSNGSLEVSSPGRPPAAIRRHIERSVRRMLNLDLDLGPFHQVAASDRATAWIAERGQGRLLRCPTQFEDLVKLVLTTNCSWALTTRMVASLVSMLGEEAGDGSRAFPRPEALASTPETTLRREAKLGYRAPLVARLSTRVANGEVDPESWERRAGERESLKREMLELPGVGPYVAENLLRLLGRPAGLGLDSWLRAEYSRVYHDGRRVSDRTIARRYRRFGSWAGLAIWCDMTRSVAFEEPGDPAVDGGM